jgi:hypothetical protein
MQKGRVAALGAACLATVACGLVAGCAEEPPAVSPGANVRTNTEESLKNAAPTASGPGGAPNYGASGNRGGAVPSQYQPKAPAAR